MFFDFLATQKVTTLCVQQWIKNKYYFLYCTFDEVHSCDQYIKETSGISIIPVEKGAAQEVGWSGFYSKEIKLGIQL